MTTESFDAERKRIRGALTNVLCNAMNFPKQATPHLLGRDMTPVIEKATDAVMATLER
jgi:hypothetical protein